MAKRRTSIASALVFATLFAGIASGFGLGLAASSKIADKLLPVAAYRAPELCELPPPHDPIGGFLTLLDAAKGREAHA